MRTTGSPAPVPRSWYSRSVPLTLILSGMLSRLFLGLEQAEGVVDGAVGESEQDKLALARGQLMPGPGWDGRHVVGQEREGLAAADERPGAAGHHDDRAGGFPARPGPGARGPGPGQGA